MPVPCSRLSSEYTELPGNGTTNESAKLVELAGAAVDSPLLICAGTHRIGAVNGNTTVELGTHRGQTVEMLSGARFLLDAGITLVIRARFIADPRQQVFRGSGASAPFLIPSNSHVRFGLDAVDELSPCWWGADPSGAATVDSAGPANRAHATAEAMIDDAAALVVNESTARQFRRGPVVRYPAGQYRVESTILLQRVLRVRGDGPNATVIRGVGTDAVFRIQLAGAQIPYHTVELRDLGIAGFAEAASTQHGVHVVHTGSATIYDTTAILDNVHIHYMGGHGFFNEDRGNTNRIRNCIIQGCRGSGIKLAGIHNTDCHIRGNVIRENRIGVEFVPAAGSVFSSGFVTNNIIESNNAGTGALGSSTRPSMGISMERTWNVYVALNYFEGQLNDIHAGGYVSTCVFEYNFHDSGTNNLVAEYAGLGAVQRRLAPVYFAGDVNTGNTLRSNAFYKPTKPAGTSAADWVFPETTWAHLPSLSGCNHLVLDDNKWLNPATGGQEDISYAPASPGVVQLRSALTLSGPPGAGTYSRGAFIRNSLPTVLGAAGSRYVVSGWARLTDGSTHALGTDWVEMRTPTGT